MFRFMIHKISPNPSPKAFGTKKVYYKSITHIGTECTMNNIQLRKTFQ